MGLFSGIFGGGGSAKRAADVAARKQSEAGQMIWDQYQTSRDDYQPYVDAGTSALGEYQRLTGELEAPTAELHDVALTMDPIVQQIREGDFTKSPGYDFRMQEGQKALERSAAAKGNLFSGATGKALQRYGQGYATSEYDNYLNRLRNQLGDIGTQMAGRTSALGARYKQLDAQGLPIQYGYSATSALGNLGASAAAQRAGYKAGEGATYASGMQAKDAQMKAAGDYWLNKREKALETMATIGTGGMYQPSGKGSSQFGSMPQQQFGGGQQGYAPMPAITPSGGQTGYQSALGSNMANPWVNPDNINYGASDPALPWLQAGQQEQAARRSQSLYA